MMRVLSEDNLILILPMFQLDALILLNSRRDEARLVGLAIDIETKNPPVAFLPYVAGVSERIRRVCQDFGIGAVFKSGPTLRGLLTEVEDPLPTEKQSSVVYEVPCTCGKVYIGETKRRLGTRLKEHKDACAKCLMAVSHSRACLDK